MSIIFVSYGRAIQEKVRALTQDLEALGHEVWFDQALAGGQAWWDQVLANIRACDVFVFALAPPSLESQACRLEYSYASDLGKLVLPVLVADGVATDLLPPALARIQYVDCRRQDKSALAGLARAFATLPAARPLPDPLPAAPDAPLSYLATLSEEVQSAAKLSFEQQTALVLRLKQGIRTDGDAQSARVLLQRFRARDDLYARVADEIDELLKASANPVAGRTRPAPVTDTPQTQWRNAPAPHSLRAATGVVPPAAASARPQRLVAAETAAGQPSPVPLAACLFAALGGVVIGFLLPALVLETLNRSLRSAPVVFSASMLLGLLPVLALQLAILRRRGSQVLASRWTRFVAAGWVVGAVAGGTVGMIHILVFGAAGGGMGALIVLTQAYLQAKAKLRTVDTAN